MYRVQVEQEEDGRWIAEVEVLPGVLAYGATREEAVSRVYSLSLQVLADRSKHGEALSSIEKISGEVGRRFIGSGISDDELNDDLERAKHEMRAERRKRPAS